MTTKPRNEKTRLLLTLELAVILPAAALVVLSAWHVLHIQRDRARVNQLTPLLPRGTIVHASIRIPINYPT